MQNILIISNILEQSEWIEDELTRLDYISDNVNEILISSIYQTINNKLLS
jgi:hypothetical protein